MRDVAMALRLAGIVVGVMFVAGFLWIVLLGPALLLLLHPR